jgi:hypothetical protein
MDTVIEVVYVIGSEEKKKLNAILAADPYAPLSFARVAPQLKELEGKLYLYIKADENFFKWADEKLKVLTSAKRAEKEEAERIIKMIHEEEEAAAGGFGGIFG